jgi:hypothetical protein
MNNHLQTQSTKFQFPSTSLYQKKNEPIIFGITNGFLFFFPTSFFESFSKQNVFGWRSELVATLGASSSLH